MTASQPLAFLNGQFVPFSQAALPVHDAGFVFGATIVDNCRTYNGRLFRWADHLRRFRHDCAACSIPLTATDAEITHAAETLIDHNCALVPAELQLVTFATPGPLGSYSGSASNGPPTLGLVTYPVPLDRYRRFFSDGVALVVVGHQSADPEALLPPRIKHRSRMLWWLADHAPRPAGAISLLCDGPEGTLTETSLASFLAVIDGVVCSPPRDHILAGISLQVTIELCDQLGIPFEERALPLGDLPRFQEAMLAGTGFGLAGVRFLNGTALTWPGPVFERLLQAWSQQVGLDLRQQMLSD